MVLAAQRTIYGIQLQMAMLLGKPYVIKPNTTLNEKFDILKDATVNYLEKGFYPELKYFSIGNGGSTLASGIKGYSYSRHSAADAALFNHLPFCLRKKDSDLTADERSKYRFRKLINVGGEYYYAYYLKVIDNIEYPDDFYIVNKVGIEHKLSLFSTNTDKLLNPVPIDKSELIDRIDESAFLTVLTKIHFNLEADDLQELENVYRLMNIENTPITEVGLCSGADMDYRSSEGTETYTEATNVQVVYHIGTNLDVVTKFNTGDSVRRSIEIGGSEPYYIGMQ